MNPFSLEGKTIFVTGASSGIGKSIAILCSQLGAKMIIVARNEDKLKATLDELIGNGHSYKCADLTKQEEVNNLVNSLPKLDGVVHCAGVGSRVLCKNLTEDEINRVMNINFVAPVLLQTVLLANKKLNKKSSVVFIASHGASSPAIANSLYSASKGAIISFTRSLSANLIEKGIRVNAVAPGPIWTPLISSSFKPKKNSEFGSDSPMKRAGMPNEVAPSFLFLATDDSSFISGQVLHPNGGEIVNG